MLTDSLYTPAQLLHSPLESEPDVLAVLMAERRLRYFLLMLSLGLGPAFPMNLNKGSRKPHFQAFDRLLPVQKQQGSMLCILAYSNPAGFSLLIVLSCAFLFCRGKNIVFLCWKVMLWTKWSQYHFPSERFAPPGPMLSEKRHTEFGVSITWQPLWVSAFADYWSAVIIHFSFNWSWCERGGLCCRRNATFFPPPCRSLGGWLSPHTSGSHRHCTGVGQMGVKESCLLLSHTLHWPISSGCMQYRCRIICRWYCFWDCCLSKPWKESQKRGLLGWWMVIEICYILLKKKGRELAYWNIVLSIPCGWFSFPGQHAESLSRAFKKSVIIYFLLLACMTLLLFLEKNINTKPSHFQKHARC